MNAILVVGREQSHEALLGLFDADAREAAEEFAEDASEEDCEAAIRKVWGVGADFPLQALTVGIVEFIEGEAQPFRALKTFTVEFPVERNGDE